MPAHLLGAKPTPLLLKTDQAPGDVVVMTAAIHSLHKAHPGRYLTAVESPYPEVFAHNPHVVSAESIPDASPLHMHYPAIHKSNERGIHFMQGWCEFLGFALDIDVPLLTNRPHLYFPELLKPLSTPLSTYGRYWVVCSGGKEDLTNKRWGYLRYQEVVARTPDIAWVQVGANEKQHPRLRGVDDMVGKTTLRDLFTIIMGAEGILCGVSLVMHVAAALEKPCVVIAGGREPVQWNAYPKQHYLHTIGITGCSDPMGNTGGACWRSRVKPLGDDAVLDANPCLYPLTIRDECVPECMTLITPEYVAQLILTINRRYNDSTVV